MLTLVTGKELNDRYVVQGIIGTGGFGSVFRATDKQLKRDVALKRLLKSSGDTPDDERRRLLAEARKHAQLVHTNIVQVYDVIECEGEHLIVMEFIDGGSVQTLLREQARTGNVLALDQTVSILTDIVAGVAFAHEKGIVHRDLSPGNILLTATKIPKLGDFGIATLIQTSTETGTKTDHRGGTGNPSYMAPEQHRGEAADQATDLFTIGVIGYLLLTGRHPFAHVSGLFTITELISDENYTPETPKPPAILTSSQQRLFREYAAVVMRLLNRERAGRYASARDALASIEAITPFQECPQCNERVPEHFAFCGFCGARVSGQPLSLQPPILSLARIEPPTPDELVEEGFELSRARRWDDAIARYHEALRAEPSNQKALRNLGFVLNRIGRHEEAEATLTRGLSYRQQLPSHEASLRHERALARTELKKYDEARSDIDRVLSLTPRSVRALYLRARVNLYSGLLPEARRDAQEVLRAVPDHLGALRLIDQLTT